MKMLYDAAIIGGGPAGYSAAIYCARFGLTTLLFQGDTVGGQMSQAVKIENYPGIACTDGVSLARLMQEQARASGAEIVSRRVLFTHLTENVKLLTTKDAEYEARAVILATGASAKRLGIEGEERMIGRGISYCAACDGALFRGRAVAVVGGGRSAASEAFCLAQYASEVHLLFRRTEMRITARERSALTENRKITPHPGAAVTRLIGEERLSGVEYQQHGKAHQLALDGLFVAIGRAPETGPVKEQLASDDKGYLLTDERCMTAVPGVFAAGDVRHKNVRQIVTAAGDGAVAAFSLAEYLQAQ